MSKKVQSSTVSLWELLATPTPYMIPHNQRPYTWDLKNWEALWNSFFSENDKSTFLGSFIFLVDPDPEKEIQVFDGQQRITTLIILCRAFIDVLHQNGFVNEASNVHNYLMSDHNDNPRLIVSKNIQDYFRNSIQGPLGVPVMAGSNSNEKDIYKAYNYFFKEVQRLFESKKGNGSDLYKSLKNRLSNLEVVKLNISNILLGIEIFETVNATGKQLNASELAKNIIIKHAQLSDEHDIESIDRSWNDINDRLEKTGFSFIEFMYYYWISKNSFVGKAKLFQAMKKKFGSESEKWLDFFKDLEQSSISFENIFTCYSFDSFHQQYQFANSNPRYSETYLRYLKCFSFIKNKSWIIPIFTLLDYETKINKRGKTYIGKNKLHKIFHKHFVFSFLHFNIYSIPTRDYTPAMYKLSKKINRALIDFPQDDNKSNAAINRSFEEHFKGKDDYVQKTIKDFKQRTLEFTEGILKLRHNGSNKFLIHNLFGEIEEKIFGGIFQNIPKNSIEHYLPQESATTWGIPKNISKKHENRLGNLLIIDADLNGKLQNKSHTEKMEILKNSRSLSKLTIEFIEQNESGDGSYNFGLITKENLENSDPTSKPSQIDLRTFEIGKYIKRIYLTDFSY